MELLFLLLAGHAVCDFALQGEVMGRGKSRRRSRESPPPPDFPPWTYWLGAHALIHGGAVALLTGQWEIGALEVVLHAAIDHAKCEERLTFRQDQALHALCKVGYVVVLL